MSPRRAARARGGVLAFAVACAAPLLLPAAAPADHSVIEQVSAGGNGPFDASFAGVSGDFSRLFFRTAEPLAPSDGDGGTGIDIYERTGGPPAHVSVDLASEKQAFFYAAPGGGERVFFVTQEAVSADDGDNHSDLYERSAGDSRLVTPNTAQPLADFNGVYGADRFIFETTEALVPADTDGGAKDVYERSGGAYTLVSTPGNGPQPAEFGASSPDGNRIFFETREAAFGLMDTDGGRVDIFERVGGLTRPVSLGPNGPFDATSREVSADGSTFFFETKERLSPQDLENGRDVYAWENGFRRLVTRGGNAAIDASFEATSADGERVFFTTREALSGSDADSGAIDVYASEGTATTLISGGLNEPTPVQFEAITTDGSRALFRTSQALSGEDLDGGAFDVYQRSGGQTSLVSVGVNGATGARLEELSAGGGRAFFRTEEAISPGDADNEDDIYERYDGATTLISAGTTEAVDLDAASPDGQRALFSSSSSLTAEDTDGGGEDLWLSLVAPPAGPGGGPAGDDKAPLLSGVSFRPKRFRRGTALPRLARRAPRRTTIRFTVSEPARVGFAAARPTSGRRVGSTCRKPTRQLRKRRKCIRYVGAGSFSRAVGAGARRIRFTGRLSSGRSLRRGPYRLTLTAADAAGNVSKPVKRAFSVVR